MTNQKFLIIPFRNFWLQEMERKLRSDTIRTTTSVTKSSIRKSAVIKEGFNDDEEKKGLTFIHSPVFSFVKASL